ncbi:vesicle-fusing ATPase [Monoraphidium neglectum]|uniref:Vesicle-fusing ATPase n=1 Tax=Monoraphidium neglectum TaxID=145388 RepID=A0A0D2K357_9CHLO|nr:vesicle-fusing ATPase [Monoraphidium neglectum]KIZ04943.1 vesicle-fusing ATPase [Monoraphidium neglectum]|eukprot:XP_013903962.1 vesicle-fusing ATPase [Monoraphidium neglectum]
MGLSAAFNVQLHVPALRPEEVARVLRQQECFELRDIPEAVDALGTYCGKEVPIKKLLLWLEMARQELPDPTAKIPLAAWQTVLQDLSS